jgi:hypothetical protein
VYDVQQCYETKVGLTEFLSRPHNFTTGVKKGRVVNTLLMAFKRRTDATEKLLSSILLGFTTISMNVLMWRQVRPAFVTVGRSDDLSVLLAITAAATIGVAVALCFKLPSEWRQIVADQARNDAAGCNIVRQKEERMAARHEAATEKAKLLKSKAKTERAMAG